MTDEPRRIFLGVVDLGDDAKSIALDIPVGADAATIVAAIAAAEAAKVAAQARESAELHKLFLETKARTDG
jgi:hypothetical protein